MTIPQCIVPSNIPVTTLGAACASLWVMANTRACVRGSCDVAGVVAGPLLAVLPAAPPLVPPVPLPTEDAAAGGL